jgi:hypothetical protein
MRLAAAAVSVLLLLAASTPGHTSPVKAAGDLSEAAALRALRELGANIRAKVAAQVRNHKHPRACCAAPAPVEAAKAAKQRVCAHQPPQSSYCVLRSKFSEAVQRRKPSPGSQPGSASAVRVLQVKQLTEQPCAQARAPAAHRHHQLPCCQPVAYGRGWGAHTLCNVSAYLAPGAPCTTISVGIGHDLSFDDDLAARHGCAGLGLDPTARLAPGPPPALVSLWLLSSCSRVTRPSSPSCPCMVPVMLVVPVVPYACPWVPYGAHGAHGAQVREGVSALHEPM